MCMWTISLDRLCIGSNSLYDSTDVHAFATVRLTQHELNDAAWDRLKVGVLVFDLCLMTLRRVRRHRVRSTRRDLAINRGTWLFRYRLNESRKLEQAFSQGRGQK